MSNKSKLVLSSNQMVNPVIDSLDAETFEVTAKKHSTLWHTNTYREPDFREELNSTTKRLD